MQLGIQYVVLDLAHGKHLAQHLRDFDRGGTHQYGASCRHHFLYLFDDGFIFFAFCFVNAVVHVDTGNGAVGWNNHYVQFVDVPQFAGFSLCRTGHTGQLVVHTEVVLQRNGGKSLCGSFYLHAFLGFDGLVQTVRITTSFHDTSRLLIHNLHLAVNYHIFVIFLEHGVCLQQLVDGMHTFAFDGIVGHQGILLFKALFVC